MQRSRSILGILKVRVRLLSSVNIHVVTGIFEIFQGINFLRWARSASVTEMDLNADLP
jgi:hypothetical protein